MSKELVKVMETIGVDEERSAMLLEQFGPFEVIIDDWAAKANSIVVTDESQTDLMADARSARLFLVQERKKIEAVHKELKERPLKEGQAIDKIKRTLLGLLKPIEIHLGNQENFVKIRETERKDTLEDNRKTVLYSLNTDVTLYDLREMPVKDFDLLVGSIREHIRLTKAEEERAEAERAAEEKAAAEEKELLEADNKRLAEEAEANAVELAKANDEKKAAEEEAALERRQKEEAELQAKKEKHEKELALRREADAKKSKVQAVEKQKEAEKIATVAILSAGEMLIIARKAITTLHQATSNDCHSCGENRIIAEEAISKIGGWLE